jgi:hypothetical protein
MNADVNTWSGDLEALRKRLRGRGCRKPACSAAKFVWGRELLPPRSYRGEHPDVTAIPVGADAAAG